MKKRGIVFLVGAGPGDPGLITVKGLEALRRADVVIYDRLANPALVAEAPRGARRINVGKEPLHHPVPQRRINRQLVQFARQGLTVVRLKGGDPCLFGRGGEEALHLAKHRIPFEIVPGVTSITAVPAYAGIPLTQRGLSSSVAIVTGHHEDPDKDASSQRWELLARAVDTLLCLMSADRLPALTQRLMRHGRAPTTPCAVISWGTWSKQRTAVGTLRTIAQEARWQRIEPPAMFIVGAVVRLRKWMNWFESKPLFRKKIIVTRPKHRAGELAALLRGLGAEVVALPAIELVRLPRTARANAILRELPNADWLILSSPEGVEVLSEALAELGLVGRVLGRVPVAAIGPKTAQQAREAGFNVRCVPADFKQEGLVAALSQESVRGKRVIIVRAHGARELLPESLRRLGARVEIVQLYQARPSTTFKRALQQSLHDGGVDCITLTSSSCAESVGKALPSAMRRRFAFASIGPVTSRTARQLGLPVRIEAKEHTVEGLTRALVAAYQRGAI